jgi:disulfide bond formation protein DsbB
VTGTWDTRAVVQALNAAGALVVFCVLIGADTVQFGQGEAPCPLCLLIRLGMLGVGFGLLLNVIFGPRPLHYGFVLLAAFFGAAVAMRQVLLHIVPGTGSYGSAVLGLHLYTWAFIVFVAMLVAVGTVLFFPRQFVSRGLATPRPLRILGLVVLVIGLALALANVVTTGIECGLGVCPDTPGPGAFG